MRGLALILIPLVLPTLLFLAYSWFMYRRQQRLGGAAPTPWWERPPYLLLLGLGVLLMAATLLLWSTSRRMSPATDYQAPRYEDGQIVRPYADDG